MLFHQVGVIRNWPVVNATSI